MKVLYIGGTGEISYSCVLAGAAAGQEVWVYNRGRNDEPLPPTVGRIVGDLADDAAYARLGQQRWDVVCQMKAYDMPAIERDLAVFGGKVGQYVFISSASAYQKPPTSYVITERTPLANPYWAYSRAKAAMETRLMEAHRAGAMNVTIVRPSHTVRRNFPGIVIGGDHVAWRMLNGRAVVIHGDGTSLWTLTHADDFAAPFVRLLGNARAMGEAFHITRHMEAYTWNQIAQAMAGALGVQPRWVRVATDTLVRYNGDWTGPLLGDKTWSVMFDNSKVMDVAGPFRCVIGLEAIMERVAGHYRRRAASYAPDEKLHALMDRIASEQERLG
jgi:nucleoside-diphosphate-sugar epimerase